MPYVLFVGRITRQKGIIHLVRAIQHLAPGFQVVLCAGAPDTPEIAAEMKAAVAAAQAKRPGVIWIEQMVTNPEKIELYSHAAVFCCPSIYEPFGIINLEAMACETAVVASAVGGIKEVVLPGETGYLVPLEQMSESPFEALHPAQFCARPRRSDQRPHGRSRQSAPPLAKPAAPRGRDLLVALNRATGACALRPVARSAAALMAPVPALSIVVPAFHEERRLPSALERLAEFCATLGDSAEVWIVVERGSDRTLEIAQEFATRHPQFAVIDNAVQRGKGHAVRTGMLRARGDVIFYMDADLSVPLRRGA